MNAVTVPATEFFRLRKGQGWLQLSQDQDGYHREFASLLLEDARERGRILDIGCGNQLPDDLYALHDTADYLDGVDPDSEILHHRQLKTRWHDTLEASPIPSSKYNLAYARDVLQYIAHPTPFFRKVSDVLQPGGVFWGVTTHGRHPFALVSRLVHFLGLKQRLSRQLGLAGKREIFTEDCQSFYHCNTPQAVIESIEGLGFTSARFYFCPSRHWAHFFPAWLRWIPHLYDRVLGTRLTGSMQILIFRLEKGT